MATTTAVVLPYPSADMAILAIKVVQYLKSWVFFKHRILQKVGFFLGLPGSPPTMAKKHFGPWSDAFARALETAENDDLMIILVFFN